MNRGNSIKSIIALTAMSPLHQLNSLANSLTEESYIQPVFFIGHGSPMNAIEENEFSNEWKRQSRTLVKPKVILCVSAHWETKGTFITAMEKPPTIHDFGGFPPALFDVEYPAKGSKLFAEETKLLLQDYQIGLDQTWGLDHGCWSILKNIYPNADIPVLQLSLDYTKDTLYHFELAKQLTSLRKKGVLIIGSGNMVHNFQYAQFNGDFNQHNGLDWALEANELFKKYLSENNTSALINYQSTKSFMMSAPSPDHYLPMIYALALRNKNDVIEFFNDAVIGASFSMTSFKLSS